jgi:DNA-binding MarR family transcriptional regulator
MGDRSLGWASVTELARLKGLNKSAISRRVARLEAAGLIKPRRGAGGAKLLEVAEFNRAAAATTDGVRELSGRGAAAARAAQPVYAPAGTAGEPSLSRMQMRRTAFDAELKKLDLEERLGRIAPLDRVRRATVEFAGTLARVIDQRPSRIEEIISANATGGLQAARAVEKAERLELRAEMARAMDAIATAAEGGSALDDLDKAADRPQGAPLTDAGAMAG